MPGTIRGGRRVVAGGVSPPDNVPAAVRRGRPRRNSNRRNSQARNHPAPTLRANARSREEYAMLITGAWQKKIESYLEVGAYLIDAKAKLPGEYEAMIKSDLPFDKSTARRLKIIAEHPILSDRAYTHALPARWMTLYLLSQLPPETLVALIEDGTVSPKLQQKKRLPCCRAGAAQLPNTPIAITRTALMAAARFAWRRPVRCDPHNGT